MTKHTKRRIRKTVNFARGLFLTLFFVFILLTASAAGGESIRSACICFAIATVCFGISYFCDYLLGGGKQSPFYH